MDPKEKAVLDNMNTRFCCRRYKPVPVEKEKLPVENEPFPNAC